MICPTSSAHRPSVELLILNSRGERAEGLSVAERGRRNRSLSLAIAEALNIITDCFRGHRGIKETRPEDRGGGQRRRTLVGWSVENFETLVHLADESLRTTEEGNRKGERRRDWK